MCIRDRVESEQKTPETTQLNHNKVFSSVNDFLKDKKDLQVVIDTCLGSFLGADLQMPSTEMYLANPIWLSIGHGTPASIGSYVANRKKPLIISGDGGFQMVAQAYSTMVKYNVPALIIILDNGLYAIEQYLIDNTFFTEEKEPLEYVKLNAWNYEEFPRVFGGGIGHRAKSSSELTQLLRKWTNDKNPRPWIVACEIQPKDLPATSFGE